MSEYQTICDRLGWLAVLVWLAAALAWATGALGQFHPRDLNPTVYVETTDTFVDPSDDSVETTFELATCTKRAADCTELDTPYDECTDVNACATCCFEVAESSNGGRGKLYCPSRICPDGCVQRWNGISYEGAGWYTSGTADTPPPPHPSRDLGQDDLELMCYIADCFRNGQPCIQGHAPWDEPDGAGGAASAQPAQDATLEFEPGDRLWDDCTTSEESWIAFLVRFEIQPGNCTGNPDIWVLGVGSASNRIRLDTATMRLEMGGTQDAGDVSANSAVTWGTWHLIEYVRNASNEVLVYVDGVDVTRDPPRTSTAAWFPGSNLLGCGSAKNCDADPTCGRQGAEMQGQYAMVLFLCSAPTAQNRSDLLSYAQSTWDYDNEPAWLPHRGARAQ